MFNIIELTKTCAKGLLIILNLLCILVALCTFGFAVVDIKILKQYGEEQAGGCYTGDVVIIVASLLMVMFAIVGCAGAARDNVKMLYMYVGFVLLMVIVEMLIAIFVSVQRYGLQFRVTEWLREDFYRNVTVFDIDQHAQLWDNLHTSYECCGLNGPDDYVTLGSRIPMSCCPRAIGARSDNARKLMYKACIETATYYQFGCECKILGMLSSDADYLIGVGAISFLVEASAILLAMWVTRQLTNSVQVYTVKY